MNLAHSPHPKLELLAQTFERLGHGAENGTWRNFYLMGATELRNGIGPAPIPDIGAGMAAALTVEQLFDSVVIRVNGPKAWSEHLTIDWHFTDLDQRYRMSLSNGVLVHYQNPGPGAPISPSPSPRRNCSACSPVAAWRASSTRATPGRSSGC